eukprot:CAMPEP_0115121870 /NCGR_PEP_ID=MMETSP0227-20121206/46488_1 /TAXON_ID=89957 /ORGANISM="Polarella glacialis, Strain CCMP 1383" /LENGTH=573 /DNA_ID=CAMNT_0002523701 /DNA_START=92 /DNA_END=1813 /DNA_ORIENTATION=+
MRRRLSAEFEQQRPRTALVRQPTLVSPRLRGRDTSPDSSGLAAAARLAAAITPATGFGLGPRPASALAGERPRRHSGLVPSAAAPAASRPLWRSSVAPTAEEFPEPRRPATAGSAPSAPSRVAPGEAPRARSADPRRRDGGCVEARGGGLEACEEVEGPVRLQDDRTEVLRPAVAAPKTSAACRDGAAEPVVAGLARAIRRSSTTAVIEGHLAALAATTTAGPSKVPVAPFKTLSSTLFSGKYNVGRFLGRGASASVWEAARSDSEKRVAVKVFDQGQRDKRQAHRELKVLSRVLHPRVLEAYEVVESSRCAQLICELVDGESLRAFSQRQPSRKLSEGVARKLYRQVVDGVSYCHERLVVHRDLKLENLLLDKCHESVKIIDFGFAAQVTSKDTKLRAFCGTPSYMAPEIIRGDGYSGFAADVWALGVVVHALLAGSLPFAARTEMQLYAKIRRGFFQFPDCLGELPRKLIKGCLRPEPSTRPSSTAIMRHSWVTGSVPGEAPVVDRPSSAQPSKPAVTVAVGKCSPAPLPGVMGQRVAAKRPEHPLKHCYGSHADLDLLRTAGGGTAVGGS